MKKLFLLILFISNVFFFAQQKKKTRNNKPFSTEKKIENNGYNINIITENTENTTLYLKIFKGNTKTTFVLDSAKIVENNHKIVLKNPNSLISFPALLSSKDKNNSVMLFVQNGVKIDLILKDKILNDIIAKDSLNKDFIAYQKENDAQRKILLAKKMLKIYPDDAVKTFFNFELVRLQANNKNEREKTIKNVEKELNFSNKNIPIMPNSYVFLNEYFKASSNYFTSVDNIFKGINCENGNYTFYINWMLKNLEFRNSKGEDVKSNYLYLLNNYLQKPNCEKKLEAEVTIVKNNLNEFKSVRLGNPLPDFKVKDISGKIFDFNQYLKDNKNITILIFFDPNCEHCIESVPERVKRIDEIESQLKVKFNKIAVMYIGVESEWKGFINNAHLENWLNVTSGDQKKSIPSLIPISGTPTYFILDKDGNLLAKNYNEPLLLNEVEKD
ncbi:TlpA family protein disulfide reductase [Halpernia sp.]|uniref:TlpA family protein disulfide reductase n=1 Tax=Halpernia sp. TaxID=2782209 RepID=UPI003A8E1A01